MSKLTDEHWKLVEKALADIYHKVKLRIDGYEVCYVLQRTGTYKLEIMCYVDGSFKGKWFIQPFDEIARKFFNVKEVFLHSKSVRNNWVKKFGKKDAVKSGCFEKIETVNATWTSFRSLKSYLIKNNESIELLEV